MKRFSNLLIPIQSESERKIDRALQRIVIGTLAISLVAVILAFVFGLAPAGTTRNALLFLGAVMVVCLVFAWRGILMPGRLVFPLVVMSVITYIAYGGDGLHDEITLGYGATLLVAGLLLGEWGSILFGVLITGCLLFLGIADMEGLVESQASQLTAADDILLVSILILVSAFIQRLLLQRLGDLLRKSQSNEQIQIKTNIELRSLQSTLEQRVAERTADLEQRSAYLLAAAEVASYAASAQNLDNLLNWVVNYVCDRFRLNHAFVFLVDDLRRNAVLMAGTGDAGRSLLARNYSVRIGEIGVIGYVSNAGTPRIVNDVEADYAYRREQILFDTRSEMALPLKSGETIIGVLDLHSDHVNAFNQDFLSVMLIVADQLAVAIQNTRLLEELGNRLKEINTLYQRYSQESLVRTTQLSKRIGFQYDLLSIAPNDRQFSPEILTKLRSGQAVEISGSGGGRQEKARLLAPLILFDQLVGILGLEDDDPKHVWSSDETGVLVSIANQVVLALDNARLIQETQLRSEQLRLLQEVTATAASQVHFNELVNSVCQKLYTGFGLLYCGIMLFDPGRKTVTVVASAPQESTSPDEKLELIEMPIAGNEIIEQVTRMRKTMVVYDAPQNPLSVAFHQQQQTRGTNIQVLVPLISYEEVIGVINMEIREREQRFTDADIRLFDQISMQISTAIEVARNFELTEQRAERERVLGETSAKMRETLDIDTVMQTAVEEIYRLFPLDEAAFVLTAAQAPRDEEAKS